MLDRVYAVETFIMDVTIPCVPNKYEKIENLDKSSKSVLKDLNELKEENISMKRSVKKMEREETVDVKKYGKCELIGKI